MGFSIDDVRETFTADAGSLIARLQTAAEALLGSPRLSEQPVEYSGRSPFETVAELGHALAGTTALVGAQSLADSARLLEETARAGQEALRQMELHAARARAAGGHLPRRRPADAPDARPGAGPAPGRGAGPVAGLRPQRGRPPPRRAERPAAPAPAAAPAAAPAPLRPRRRRPAASRPLEFDVPRLGAELSAHAGLPLRPAALEGAPARPRVRLRGERARAARAHLVTPELFEVFQDEARAALGRPGGAAGGPAPRAARHRRRPPISSACSTPCGGPPPPSAWRR